MTHAFGLVLVLLLAACGGSPPPAAPPPPPAVEADEHPVVIASPREPVAATPLAPPGGAAPAPAPAPPADARAAPAAPGPFPPRPVAPARLAPARGSDLVGAWRVIALSGEGADSSRAATVFVEFAADGTVAELVLESGAPPRSAAELAKLLGAAAPRERWTLNGEVVVVARSGGFPPESWTVERVAAPGTLDDARAEAGDVVRALVGRSGRPGARQLLRRLPGVPGA